MELPDWIKKRIEEVESKRKKNAVFCVKTEHRAYALIPELALEMIMEKLPNYEPISIGGGGGAGYGDTPSVNYLCILLNRFTRG